MKIKILFIAIFLFIVSGFSSFVSAADVEMYFFWGDGCPHCAAAKPFIEQLKTEYPELKVVPYEIYNNKDNYTLFTSMADTYNMPQGQRGVPSFFIGNEAFSGYSEAMQGKFRNLIEGCIASHCDSPATKLSQDNSSLKNATTNSKSKSGDSKYSVFMFFLLVVVILGIIYYIFIKKEKE